MGSRMPRSAAMKAPPPAEPAEPAAAIDEIRPNLLAEIELIRPSYRGGQTRFALQDLGPYTTVGQLQARLNTEHRLWGTDRLVLFNSDRALNRDEMLKDIFATMAEPFRIQAVAWIPSSEWLSIVHGDNPGHESPVSGSEEERVRLAHDSKRYCASVCPPARCPICLEYFPLPGASGECCSYHGGFVCHECLGGLLKSSPHQARLVIHPGSRVRYQLGLHCTEASGNCLGTLELRDAMALDPTVVRDFLASIRKCAGCGDTASVTQAAVDGRCRGNHTLCDTCLEAQVVRDVAAHDVAFDGGLVCGCRRSDGKPCSERLAMAAYRDRLSEDARTALMTELLLRREALVNGYEQNEVWSVEAVRTFAIEHIINHRCPACRKTFQDHTDCPSVTCSNCSGSFCARCLRFGSYCPGYDRQHDHEHWHRGRRMRRLAAFLGSYDMTEEQLMSVFDDSFRAVLRRIGLDPELLLTYVHLLRTPTEDNLLQTAAQLRAKADEARRQSQAGALTLVSAAAAAGAGPGAPPSGPSPPSAPGPARPIPIPHPSQLQAARVSRRFPPREAPHRSAARSISPPRHRSPAGQSPQPHRQEEESAAASSSPPLTPRVTGGPQIMPDDSWIVVGRRNRSAATSGSSGGRGGYRRWEAASGRGGGQSTMANHRGGGRGARPGSRGGRAAGAGDQDRGARRTDRQALLADIVALAETRQEQLHDHQGSRAAGGQGRGEGRRTGREAVLADIIALADRQQQRQQQQHDRARRTAQRDGR